MRLRFRRARYERIKTYHINHPELTLDEIGKHYKLTAVRIGQIIKSNKVENKQEGC